jgi:hypothetical protein
MHVVRRGLLTLLVVGVLAVGIGGGPAEAQEDGTTEEPAPTTLPQLPDDAGRIIKRPNYGHEPTHEGDRGGWQQGLVVLLLAVGVGALGGLAWRESRRRRTDRGEATDAVAPRRPAHH